MGRAYLTGQGAERPPGLVCSAALLVSSLMDLHPITMNDLDAVSAFFERAADYVMLETGAPPTVRTTQDFFDDRPPHVGPDAALHFAASEQGQIMGLMGMVFGYPNPRDAYIGLLLFDPAARGQGHGADAVQKAVITAQSRGADRLLVAVLEANPKGRAFWQRQGFKREKTFPPTKDGHIRHRLIRPI